MKGFIEITDADRNAGRRKILLNVSHICLVEPITGGTGRYGYCTITMFATGDKYNAVEAYDEIKSKIEEAVR